MIRTAALLVALGVGAELTAQTGQAAEPVATATVRERTGIERREPWTTDHLQGTPEPPDPYTTEDAFPKLKFLEPLSVGPIPGSSMMAVATRPGRIYAFENRPDVSESTLIVDTKRAVYGVVFHPQFARNRYFFVSSVVNDTATGSRVSRFEWRETATPEQTLATEQVVLEWPAGGHNGGCLRFGPEGYLYLATGDGSGIADGLETGQRIDDLLGSILRIDIDHPSGDRLYSIPVDNPFVKTPAARGEIWSFGHRQVWKFSFDQRQRLWAGEVGQDLWEMIYVIRRGGNYGWSVREGSHPFRPDRPIGPGSFEKPIVEHPHSDFRSITAGYVSRTSRLPELKDCLIYGDYDTGKLWALKYESGAVTVHRQLADTQIRIVEFAQDDSGEVLLVDFAGGGLHRIVTAPPAAPSAPFPRKLSETGLFESTNDLKPARGMIPYSVNAPLWSDHAEKDRWLALPGLSQIERDAVIYPHGPSYPDVGWRFPDRSVLVKTFSLETEVGNPASRRRLETRILQYRKMPGNDDEYGAQFWLGYTYVWNDAQTDAELLDAAGRDQTFRIRDAAAPGGYREQTWHYPSRAECALCHTMASKYVLGVTTLQMNKDHDYGGVIANQLTTLEHLGVFTKPLDKPPGQLPRLADYRDEQAPQGLRARAYLHANCAHCHRKWGGGNAEFELQASLPLEATLTVDTRPGQGTFQLADPRILVPGNPERSLVWHRMQRDGLGRMPHIASSVKDKQGIDLVRDWIAGLTTDQLKQSGAINPRRP